MNLPLLQVGCWHLWCLLACRSITLIAAFIFTYLLPVFLSVQIAPLHKDPDYAGVVIVVHAVSPVWLFVTPWTVACQAPLSSSISRSVLKLMSIELGMPSNHLILCHPLLFLPSIFPSIRVFSNELVLQIRWSKYWSFSFSNSPSNEYSGLISFRIDRFDLLAIQGTLRCLLQHHISKASILWHAIKLPLVVTPKTIAETRDWTRDL